MSTQAPREIAFEDIRVGDEIRAECAAGGVKFTREGVAHENTYDGWFTSGGGLIVVGGGDEVTITLLHRPVPAEPKGLGAVVRAALIGGDVWVFTRVGDGWVTRPRNWYAWSDFDPDSIEVLSEGIEVES